MDEEIAAYIHRIAPMNNHANWHQQGIKRVLDEWKTSSPTKYDVAVTNRDFGICVGYHIYPDGVGQYNYDTRYHFEPDLDPEVVDELDDPQGLCEAFYEAWVTAIQELIAEAQTASAFTPKELATLYANRNPTVTEARAADALGITVGTYRGKVGRVKEKLEEARATLAFDELTSLNDDEWHGGGYEAPIYVIDQVEMDRLPVNASGAPREFDRAPNKWPVEKLLRE